jgi:spore coat polysaccharide biosynthesis protein SpsF
MKVGIIVQARMTSTRLPGKVLLPVLRKPLLEYQIERLQRVSTSNEIIIATTVNEADQPIVDLCQRLGVKAFRGSEKDVLSRYFGAAQANELDIVVRVTSDCPLIDPTVIDNVIHRYQADSDNCDYVSNTLERTFPRGMDTEVFPFELLEKVHLEARQPHEREHVTPYIYQNPQRFRLLNLAYILDESRHRWTVDTLEDFELIRRILVELYPLNQAFGIEDVLALMDVHPKWFELNSAIEQKKLPKY